MQISVVVTLDEGQAVPDPNWMAEMVLESLGGDPTKDFCVMTISPPHEVPHGYAGKDPNLPEEASV